MNKAVLALIAILVLPGCVTEDNVVDMGESQGDDCLLYTSPSPRDVEESRMPSSA